MKADESQDIALNVQSVTFSWKRMKERRGGVTSLRTVTQTIQKARKGPAPSIFRKLVVTSYRSVVEQNSANWS